MIAFLDSSVVARQLLGEPQRLKGWSGIAVGCASRLMPVELGRMLDRMRLAGDIDDDDVAHLHAELRRIVRSLEIVSVTEAILEQAAGPLLTVIGTLDAIHLVTALKLKRKRHPRLVMATHDVPLGRAARASGFEVIGA